MLDTHAVAIALVVSALVGEFIAFLIWLRDETKYHNEEEDQ